MEEKKKDKQNTAGGCGCLLIIIIACAFWLGKSDDKQNSEQKDSASITNTIAESSNSPSNHNSLASTNVESAASECAQDQNNEDVELPEFTIVKEEEIGPGRITIELSIDSEPESVASLRKAAMIVGNRMATKKAMEWLVLKTKHPIKYEGTVPFNSIHIGLKDKNSPHNGYVYGYIRLIRTRDGVAIKDDTVHLISKSDKKVFARYEDLAIKKEQLKEVILGKLEEFSDDKVSISNIVLSQYEGDTFTVWFDISAPEISKSLLGVDIIKNLLAEDLPYPIYECIANVTDIAGSRIVKYLKGDGFSIIKNGKKRKID